MAFRLTVCQLQRRSALQDWCYRLAGFNKYGLYRDDLLRETEDVTEALRRLPPHLLDERNFRLVRAVQLNLQKVVLPKEEWTKLEDDVLYLSPLVKIVKEERLEREDWDSHY